MTNNVIDLVDKIIKKKPKEEVGETLPFGIAAVLPVSDEDAILPVSDEDAKLTLVGAPEEPEPTITYVDIPPPPPPPEFIDPTTLIAEYEAKMQELRELREVTAPTLTVVPKPPPAYVPPEVEITPEETVVTAKKYLEETEKAKEEIVEHYEEQIAEIDPTVRYEIALPEGDPRGKTWAGTGEYLILLLEEFKERDISASTREVIVARAGVASATEYALATKVGKAVEVELERPIPFAPWKPEKISGALLEAIARGVKKRVGELEYPIALESIVDIDKIIATSPKLAEDIRRAGGKEKILAHMWEKSLDIQFEKERLKMQEITGKEADAQVLKMLAENKASAQRIAMTVASGLAIALTAGIAAPVVMPLLEAAAPALLGVYVAEKGIELGEVLVGEKRPELFFFETAAELITFGLMPATFEVGAELRTGIIDILRPPKPVIEIEIAPKKIDVSELITLEKPKLVKMAGRLEIIEAEVLRAGEFRQDPKVTEMLFKQTSMLEEPFIDIETTLFKVGEVPFERYVFTEEILGKVKYPKEILPVELELKTGIDIDIGVPIEPKAIVSIIERPMQISTADIMYFEAPSVIGYKGMIEKVGFKPIEITGVAERLPKLDILPSDIITIEPVGKPSIAMKPFITETEAISAFMQQQLQEFAKFITPPTKAIIPTGKAALAAAALEFYGLKPPKVVKPIVSKVLIPPLAVPKFDVRLYDAFGLTEAGKIKYPPALDIKPLALEKFEMITPELIGVKPITKPIAITEIEVGIGVKPAELVGVVAKEIELTIPKVSLALDVGLAEIELLKVPAPAVAKVKPLEIGLIPPITPPPPPRPPRITLFDIPEITRRKMRIPKRKIVKKISARDFFYTPTLAGAEFLKFKKKKPIKRIWTGLEIRAPVKKGKKQTLKGVKFL